MNFWVIQCKASEYPNEQNELDDWQWARNDKGNPNGRKGAVSCFDKMENGDKALCFLAGESRFVGLFELLYKTPSKDYKELAHFKIVQKLDISLFELVKNMPEILLKNNKKSAFSFENSKLRQGTYFSLTEKQFNFILQGKNAAKTPPKFTPKQVNLDYDAEFLAHKNGKEAEQIFEQNYQKIQKFAKLKIKDVRENGVGYDFELGEFVAEIKGVSEDKEAVFFTKKEWAAAQKMGEKYFLVVVNLADKTMQIVQNPSRLQSKEIQAIALRYSVNFRALGEIIEL